MKQFLEWEIIFCVELLKYIIAYRITTRQTIHDKKKEILVTMMLSILAVILLIKTVSINDAYIVLMILSVGSLFICMKERYLERIWKILVIFLSVTAIDSVMENLVGRFTKTKDLSMELEIIIWDGMSIACMAFILVIVIVLGKRLEGRKIQYSNKLVQCSVIFADICLCMCASFVFRDVGESKFYFWLGTLSFIGVVFLGSQILRILEMNNTLKDAILQERFINGIQKEYYQTILRNEEEIRKYRHDMNNHFMVIESYLQKEKLKKAEEYIDGLKEKFMTTSMKKYFVGNDVIDAISGYYLPLIDEFVDIDVNGFVQEEMDIDEINLCTIYSNLLKNAVEELQRLKRNNRDNLKLKIEFVTGKNFFKIEIKNTAKENAQFNGIMTPTSKNDKKDHGIGLSNIMRALDKENGEFSLYQLDETICADVIIPIKRCASN